MAGSLGGVFGRIYRENAWEGRETRSGPGSSLAATAEARRALLELTVELGITSVLDVACGEGWWQPELPGYLGVDVAPEAIERARALHPERRYWVRDVVAEGLPIRPGARAKPWGLVLCRDAMQHLSLSEGVRMLEAIREGPATWLLASTYVWGTNREVPTGDGAYSPDLEAPPFGLPPALRLYHDGFDYEEGLTLRDRTKMLGLWRLR